MSFKENCNDTRNSKVFDIIYNLSKNFKINVYDPYINKKDVSLPKSISLIKKSKKINMMELLLQLNIINLKNWV